MEVKNNRLLLNNNLSLINHHNSLLIQGKSLVLNQLQTETIDCRLTLSAPPDLHQRIEAEALFNYKPEICAPLSDKTLSPDLETQIEISLQPDFLPTLVEHIANVEDAGDAFLKLNQEQPNHPLFATQNWLLLSATQTQASGPVGYRTLWHYLNPVTLAQAATTGSPDSITDALEGFFNDWRQNKLSSMTEKAAADVMSGITHFLKGFEDFNLNDVIKLAKEFDAKTAQAKRPAQTDKTILQQMLDFFTEDDWGFSKLQGETTLQLAFQGKNGHWACYAQAKEARQQFVFYSVYPAKALEHQRPALAEWITRANYGLIIGNFELDFEDGEIRYKTSLDASHGQLASMMKSSVYANVLTMDQYLPGIQAVLEGIAPTQAVRIVEQDIPNVDLPHNSPVSPLIST